MYIITFKQMSLKYSVGFKLIINLIYTHSVRCWRRKWQPTPVFLPGKTHGQRGLAFCSPWGRKESDTTQQLNNNIFLFISNNTLKFCFTNCHHYPNFNLITINLMNFSQIFILNLYVQFDFKGFFYKLRIADLVFDFNPV